MKKKILSFLPAALALCLLGGIAWSATVESVQLGRDLQHGTDRYVTTDTSIGMRVQWNPGAGAVGSATVAVDGSGNLAFVNAAGAADTTVNGTGSITVSGLGFGKVCDLINVSSNWRAILVDVLPSQSASALKTLSATGTGLTNSEGIGLFVKTATLLAIASSVGPEYTVNDDIGSGPNTSGTGSLGNLYNRKSTPNDPVAGPWTNEVYFVKTQGTFTSGTTELDVYQVSSDHNGATETLLWSQVGAATATNFTLDFTAIVDPATQTPMAITAKPGKRIVVLYKNVTGAPNLSAGNMQIHAASRKPQVSS